MDLMSKVLVLSGESYIRERNMPTIVLQSVLLCMIVYAVRLSLAVLVFGTSFASTDLV